MTDTITDLSMVPQVNESMEQRAGRLQWFRDAKFGLFIHWGPCSIGEREIGWGREGNRPWDINKHGPREADPEYDNYYKEFNPVKYDADEWVKFAKASGMKYMVLITKHHDGFSMYDSALTEYDIMETPYGKDIVKAYVDACHRHDMKVGFYYSTRDWYHDDYLVGDNVKYDEWYRAQIEELLTNYGKIDVMWFDHVGGRNWAKWRFDDLYAMMYRLQPHLVVNNRAAKFCGPESPEDEGPPSKAVKKMCEGDYYTPEGRIGSMDITRDWESCIHVGKGWSYRGEDGFKGPEDCIKMLVSCTTGGGNLLLNFGPRPDGSFTDGETDVATALGEWLGKYGDAIYGTRGGPYQNGHWGGSCHRGNKMFLHVYEWPEHGPLELDPLPREVLSARTLDGHWVDYIRDAHELAVSLPKEHRKDPVTVIELTLDRAIEPGTIFGVAHELTDDMTRFGKIISREATFEASSASSHDNPDDHNKLFRGDYPTSGYAFYTDPDENPWMIADLGDLKTVNAIVIENREGEYRTEGMIVSVSEDKENWDEIWTAPEWDEKWLAVVTHFHAGIDVLGRKARYIKFETRGEPPRPMLLKRVVVYGGK